MTKKKFVIRKMEPADVEQCLIMARESFGDDYPDKQFETMREEFEASFVGEWWGRPNYFVCLCEEEVVGMGGYSLSWLDWDTFEMFWLSVKNGWKGQGIGTMLQQHREAEIIKESAFKDDITILFSATKTVVDFHLKNGYKVILEKASGKEVLMGKSFLKNEIKQIEVYRNGIIPKDSSYKNSKIYNGLKSIPGTSIDMVKGIIFLDGDMPAIQKYLDENRDLFEYTK